MVKQDEKTFWFKDHFKGVEVGDSQARSLLQDVVDRELTTFEEYGLALSRSYSGSTTIDVVSMLVTGKIFLWSAKSVVIGYAIRDRADSSKFNYGDPIGSDGFRDTDGHLNGQLTVYLKEEPGLESPLLDPIDFIGGALADIVRRAARMAVEMAEESVARYLAREGTGAVGGMAGPNAAASAFWKAGEVTPRAFASAERRTLTDMIKSRMKTLGIPKENIGIRGIPGESGEAFTAEGTFRGGNVRGKGISVHGSVMEAWSGFPEWNKAILQDRIDAVIAHEWMEFNELTHWETVELGTESKLPISQNAKKLLGVMRGKGKGLEALEDKVPR
jgi:hypothetical protein